MIEIALLILTLATDGEHRLTLVETDSLADCQETSETLAGILTGAGIDFVASQCGETSLRLTPFEHGASRKRKPIDTGWNSPTTAVSTSSLLPIKRAVPQRHKRMQRSTAPDRRSKSLPTNSVCCQTYSSFVVRPILVGSGRALGQITVQSARYS